MVLVVSLSLCACGRNNNKTEAPAVKQELETTEKELSDGEIERIAAKALYDKIVSDYEDADAGSSRYSVNKIEQDEKWIYVYGTVYLYDKYGKLTTGYRDGSGSYTKSFSVEMTHEGTVYYDGCEIDGHRY